MTSDSDFDELPPEEPAAPRKKGSLLGGLIWTFGRTLGIAVVQFAVLIVTSRVLSLQELGWASAALVLANLATMLSQLGISDALIQRQTITNAHISTAMIASQVTGILQALLMVIFAPYITAVFGLQGAETLFRVLAIVFIVNAVSRTAYARLSREMHFQQISKAELISSLAYGIVAIALALYGLGAWSIIIALIVQSVLRTGLMMRGEPLPRPFRYDAAAMAQLRQTARGFSLATILTYIASQADSFIVSTGLGAASLGLYSRATETMKRPASLVAQSLNRVLFPAMSREQNDRARLTELYFQTTTGMAIAVLPLGVVCAVLGRDIILGLFGARFEPAILPFQILSAGMIFKIGFQSSDAITKAAGDAFARVGPRVVFLIAVLGLGFLGIRWGLPGVAAGVLTANIIHLLLMAHQSMKHIDGGWGDYLRSYQGPLVVAAVSGGAAWLASAPLRAAGTSYLASMFAGLIAAGLVGAVILKLGNRALLGRDLVAIREILMKRLRKRKV